MRVRFVFTNDSSITCKIIPHSREKYRYSVCSCDEVLNKIFVSLPEDSHVHRNSQYEDKGPTFSLSFLMFPFTVIIKHYVLLGTRYPQMIQRDS